jgi:hypothetical protein
MIRSTQNHERARVEAAVADSVQRDRAWLPHDRRGRWVVVEPGAGHYMTSSPRDVRRVAELATPRRARRFSSLSRARAFARSVDGTVRRWRRAPPGGGIWRRESPWQWATRGRGAVITGIAELRAEPASPAIKVNGPAESPSG